MVSYREHLKLWLGLDLAIGLFSQSDEGKSPLPPFSKGGIESLQASSAPRHGRASMLRHFPLWKRGIGDLYPSVVWQGRMEGHSRSRRPKIFPLWKRGIEGDLHPSVVWQAHMEGHSRSRRPKIFPLWKRGIEGDLYPPAILAADAARW